MTKAKVKEPSYEEALEELESIVTKMEDGDVPLAELLAQFEAGSKLLKQCESRLKDAELRIEKLKRNKDGSNGFESFETADQDD
jgi:exodeoxyribonuclease VII small subunit